MLVNTMKRRPGKPATSSTSVDSETHRILEKEAKRKSGLDWLLQRSGATPMKEVERDALLAEIDGRAPVRALRRARP